MARRRAAKSAPTAKRKTTRAKAAGPARKRRASPASRTTRAAKPAGAKSPAKRASSGAAASEEAPEAGLISLERLTGALAESGEGVRREVTALGRGLRAGLLAGAEAFRKPKKRR